MTVWSQKEMALIMKASVDPVFFAEHPFFLGLTTLFPKQKEALRLFYEGNYRELIMLIGRRSGKTFLTSIFALYEAFLLLILDDPAAHFGLAPGSKIFIMAVAASEKQAQDTIYTEILNRYSRSPFFKRIPGKQYSLEIRFPEKNVIVFCGTSSSASMVGRAVKLLIIDEIDRFEETTSKRGAWKVYNALSSSTMTFGHEGRRIVISSPVHADSIMMQLIARAEQYDDMLPLRYATWEFNPNIPFDHPDMVREREKDPINFWTEYGAKPSAVTEHYFGNREILKIDDGVPNLLEMHFNGVLKSVPAKTYVFTGDPALKHDAFGIALGHIELDEYYIDGLWRFKSEKGAELNPLDVRDKILGIADTFHPLYAVFDTWGFPETQEEIRRKGIPIETHIVKKEEYDRVKELFYQGKLHVCNYPLVIDELKNLRLYRGKRVDHPPGGSKDVADALANLVWALEETFGGVNNLPLIVGVAV